MSIRDFVNKQLEIYRDRLANLSRRNRELFFKENRTYSINLTAQPTDKGKEKDKPIEFSPLACNSSKFTEAIASGRINLTKHFSLGEIANPDLLKRLEKVKSFDTKYQKEYGLSGAWLLGPFLIWRDTINFKKEDLLITPIFKLPIDLEFNKQKNWHLKLEDTNLNVNPTLKLALRMRWGIEIPDVYSTDEPRIALDAFKQAIIASGKEVTLVEGQQVPKVPPRYKTVKDESGEIVSREAVTLSEVLSIDDLEIYEKTTNKSFFIVDVLYIDQLNANRNVLIKDYEEICQKPNLHPLIQELFSGTPVAPDDNKGKDTIRQLDQYKERENYFTVNIDSTQHRAIDTANKNRAIVIQGPPGTGKSQTITNLIADHLAKGKRVLFVSEKRPALDVVFSRLQQAQLAGQSVLIHGSELNKQELYASFVDANAARFESEIEGTWDRTATELDTIKNEINCYYAILDQVHTPSGLRVCDLFASVVDLPELRTNYGFDKLFSHLDFNQLKLAQQELSELGSLVRQIPRYSNHPWLSRKSHVIYTRTFERDLRDEIEILKEKERELVSIREKIRAITGNEPKNVLDDARLLQFANLPVSENWLEAGWSFYLEPKSLETFIAQLSAWENQIYEVYQLSSRINSGSDLNQVIELEKYFAKPRNFFYNVFPLHRKMSNLRKSICKDWTGSNSEFEAFRVLQENKTKIAVALATLGAKVDFLELDRAFISQTLDEAKATFRNLVVLGNVARELAAYETEFVLCSPSCVANLKETIVNLFDLKKKEREYLRHIAEKQNHLNRHFEKPINLSVERTNDSIYQELLDSVEDLVTFDKVHLQLEKVNKYTKTTTLCDKHLCQLWNQEMWDQICKSEVFSCWLDDLLSASPHLRSFESKTFSAKVERFKELESMHREAARASVANTTSKNWNSGFGEGTGLALLKKEASKQKKVISPREIMERGALSAMLKLKPCWLMSPLSISQMLPLEPGLFDTIIFDEASQVRVEDAIPSIYRASSMIVVGDPKQMPPTNFFSGSESEDELEDEEDVAESVLDLASRIYPALMLEWHYRSRSESLIAFSNRAFYGGRLVAPPNPCLLTASNALHFKRVQDGYFTQKEGNIGEASQVIFHLFNFLKERPNKSVGIIAMGQSQMLALEKAVDDYLIKYPDARSVYDQACNFKDGDADAGFFIKNLENVQGDERDVIFISCGYAPSAPNTKLRQNFGPLSKKGGGRRLNVAITRAKQEMHVFCSFDPSVISTDEEKFAQNPDLAVFGRFLKYAKAVQEKNENEVSGILNSFGIGGSVTTRKSSNFSKDVYRRLRDLGYEVSAEIGSSGFFIDLAVHHPTIRSNFILGIECDGALFHSTPYARDRDKIRETLLVSRGWRIMRIWSQDWSKNWKSEMDKIDRELKQILDLEIAASQTKSA